MPSYPSSKSRGTCLAAMVSPVTTVEPSDDVVPHEDMDELDDQMATGLLWDVCWGHVMVDCS